MPWEHSCRGILFKWSETDIQKQRTTKEEEKPKSVVLPHDPILLPPLMTFREALLEAMTILLDNKRYHELTKAEETGFQLPHYIQTYNRQWWLGDSKNHYCSLYFILSTSRHRQPVPMHSHQFSSLP